MSKYFLLSASVIALLSSQTFASRQLAQQIADEESREGILVDKLLATHDYTFDDLADPNRIPDPDRRASPIKNAVLVLRGNEGGQEPSAQEIIDIKFEAKHKMRTNLDNAKNSNRKFAKNSWYLTTNRHGDLCVGSVLNGLVYSTKRQNRDKSDSFLPIVYHPHSLSRPLYDEIRSYATHKRLLQEQEDRLYKYIEPLSQIVKEEVRVMVEGDADQNIKGIKDLPRWVYNKSWQEMLDSIKLKTDLHLYMIKYGNVSGLGAYPDAEVENVLSQTLMSKALSLLPNPNKEIYVNNQGQKYYLGFNHQKKLSLIHPSNGLPYPIFKDQRPKGDMNLPEDYQYSSSLGTQWQRVGTFLSEKDMLQPVQRNLLKVLLEPVAYMAHEHFKTLRIGLSNELLQAVLQRFIDQEFDIQPQNGGQAHGAFANVVYQHTFLDQAAEDGLKALKDMVATHRCLVSDLYPAGLQARDRDMIADDLVDYLLFNNIIDRIKDRLQDRFLPFVQGLRAIGNN